jgi:hypothetical protein
MRRMLCLPVVVLGLLMVAPAANAAAGNVTITIGNWNCPAGGSVIASWGYVSNGGSWNAAPGNTAHTWSVFGVQDWVQFRVRCKKNWFQQYDTPWVGTYRYFWPGATSVTV